MLGRGPDLGSSDRRGAERVTLGSRGLSAHLGSTVETRQHPSHHAPIHGADDGMVDGHVAEGTVLIDDAQLVVAAFGMSREAMGRERICDGLERRSQRFLTTRSIGTCEPRCESLAVLVADFFSQSLGIGSTQAFERPPEQGQHEIIGTDRSLERGGGVADPVMLRGTSRSGAFAALDGDFDVSACGQLVEMMARHIGMHPELLSDLGGGHTFGTFPNEQVDPPSGRIAKGGGDCRHRGGESPGCEIRTGWVLRHAGILPIAVVEIWRRGP